MEKILSAPSSALELVQGLSPQQQKTGLITAATIITSYAFYKLLFSEPDDGCPTVPYKNRLYGWSNEYRNDPEGFTRKWTKELGPVFRVHLFGKIHTVVSGPYVREVFMNPQLDFFAGTNRKFDVQRMAGIESIEATAERLRKIIVKNLTPNLKSLTPRAVANLNIGLRETVGELNEPVELRNLYPMISRMVARASASAFVGTELCKNDELVSIFQNITIDIASNHHRVHASLLEPFDLLNKLRMSYMGKFNPRVKYYRTTMLKIMTPEIDRRLEGAKDPSWEKPQDVLQELIDSSTSPPGRELYIHLMDSMIMLIFASVHTTSENGTIVLYRILQHPELIHDLMEEQKEVLKSHGLDPNGNVEDVFSFDALKGMKKLDSICRESMRLRNQYLELAHTNMGSTPVTLSNGTIIPPGTDVLINSWYNQLSDDWEDQPDGDKRTEFKPYRFLDTGYISTKVGDHYIVFGEGKHACPGRWFAVQEIKTVVSLLLRDYKISAPDGVVFPTKGSMIPSGRVIIQK